MIKSIKSYCFFILILCTITSRLPAQTTLSIKNGEQWFGGAINDAHLMPFNDGYSYNMFGDLHGNQAVPLLVSTKGRFIWSEEPFQFSFDKNNLVISHTHGSLTIDSAGKNMQEAFTNVSKTFLPIKK